MPTHIIRIPADIFHFALRLPLCTTFMHLALRTGSRYGMTLSTRSLSERLAACSPLSSPYLMLILSGAMAVFLGKLRIECDPLYGAYWYVMTCATWSFGEPPATDRSDRVSP